MYFQPLLAVENLLSDTGDDVNLVLLPGQPEAWQGLDDIGKHVPFPITFCLVVARLCAALRQVVRDAAYSDEDQLPSYRVPSMAFAYTTVGAMSGRTDSAPRRGFAERDRHIPSRRYSDSPTVVHEQSEILPSSLFRRVSEAKSRIVAKVRRFSTIRLSGYYSDSAIQASEDNTEDISRRRSSLWRKSSVLSRRLSMASQPTRCALDESIRSLKDDEYIMQLDDSTHLVHQRPPWSRDTAFWWEFQEPGQRVVQVQNPWFRSWREYSRPLPNLAIWRAAKLAAAGGVSEEFLKRAMFDTSVPRGSRFTLTPASRSNIPLQWLHVGAKAIPDALADRTFQAVELQAFLDTLNLVFGTDYGMEVHGLRACLVDILDITSDFGQAYGYLRPWWTSSATAFDDIPRDINERRKQDVELRRYAIRENCISPSRIPPRRLWDLCSNRVLPIYAFDPKLYCDDTREACLSMSVCRVSHSWVDEDERHKVWTRINSEQWPVPIPRSTTLEHIRVEMLNMGAEYVWLDVLCLRQKLDEGDGEYRKYEAKRKEEWKLDIPTIGSIFDNPDAYVITYFNGLGLALDTSAETCSSSRHWFNRVWTLQETSERWILGGVTGDRLLDGDAFFRRLQNVLARARDIRGRADFPHISPLLPLLAARYCATEVDRISGLAYLLGCRTLPVYDETITIESAWALLVKHLPPTVLGELFFHPSAPEAQPPFDLWPSWGQLQHHPPPVFPGGPPAKFWLADYSHLATREPGMDLAYLSLPRLAPNSYDITVLRRCRISHAVTKGRPDGATFAQIAVGDRSPIRLSCSTLQNRDTGFSDRPYALIGYPDWKLIPGEEDYPRYWVITELISDEVFEDRRFVAAVRWGLLILDFDEARRFATELQLKPGRQNISVEYLRDEKARDTPGRRTGGKDGAFRSMYNDTLV